LVQVGLPALGSYLARLAIVAVFLAAYGIPATFHNVATVTASNSISNSVSATPGGVGVTQALNTTALAGSANAATATAYSISQQLVTTAWNVVFATIMVSWVFGWSSGRELVETSYKDAKVRSREIRDQHRRREAKPPSPT
jgi:isocitrate dehydrogenase